MIRIRWSDGSVGDAGWLRRYSLVLGVNLLALLLTWLLLPFIQRSVFIFFFAAVAINAWSAGLLPAVVTTTIGVLSIGFFIIPPVRSLNVGLEGFIPLGVFTAIAVLISSLTEARRRAEVRARAEGERFRVTLASIGDAVVVADGDARVTFLNAVAATLSGWSAAAAVGQPVAEVLPLTDETSGAPIESPTAAVLRDGRSRALANHTWLTARDGTRLPIANSAAPICADTGTIIGVVMVFRDMRERVEAEAARVRLLASEQAARHAAEQALGLRDQFLLLASHELKTPLTSVMGNIQLLQRRLGRSGSFGEREQHMLQVVADQTQRLYTMVLSLLDVARIAEGQLTLTPAPTDIGTLTQRVVDEVQLGKTDRTIMVEVDDTALLVDGDPLRLEQVVQNLLQNALKYSRPGTPVTIRLAQQDGAVVLAVSDQGIGIPAAALPQLFERFYRAPNAVHSPISGLGVGLAIVHTIVTLHGGRVTVESTEGQGSTFTVTLPALNAERG